MLKLYITYLAVGLLLARVATVVLAPNASENALDLLNITSLISAVSLFSAMPVVSLYKPKISAIIGVVILAGIFPLIWLILRTGLNQLGILGEFAFAGYFVALAVSLIVIFKKGTTCATHNKFLRLCLSVAPLAILVFWLAILVLRFK